MTQRKPDGLGWQSWIDRQIRDGEQGGAFDDLPGHGQPIDNIGVVHDELWWLKAKLRDEDIEDVNARIRYINSHGASGPPSTAGVIDVEELLGRWSAAHPAVPAIEDQDNSGRHGAVVTRRWWQRLVSWWRSSTARR